MNVNSVRRSLTVTGPNDQRVQLARALFLGLGEHPIDFDYTSMVNLLIELGHLLLMSNWYQSQTTMDSKKVRDIIVKYCVDSSLRGSALGDQLRDWFIDNLPKLLEQRSLAH